jgi:hypothetical protein
MRAPSSVLFPNPAAHLPDVSKLQSEIPRIADERYQTEKAQQDPNTWPPYETRQVLAAIGGEHPSAWLLTVQQHSFLQQWTSHSIAIGDASNPAIVWCQLYDSILVNAPKRTADDLTFLVAHTMREASRLNPVGIRGMDIVVCRGGVTEWLVPNRIKQLTRQSEELHAMVSNKLFP